MTLKVSGEAANCSGAGAKNITTTVRIPTPSVNSDPSIDKIAILVTPTVRCVIAVPP
jgi:hypothetical protein